MRKHKELIFSVLLPACLHSATFYVSENGNDSSAGNSANPFKTLERARDEIRQRTTNGYNSNYTVKVEPGRYYLDRPLELGAGDIGDANYSVTYRAKDINNKPILTGSIEIGGTWQQHSGNIWRINVPGVAEGNVWFRDLVTDGVRSIRSREPDFSPSEKWEIGPMFETDDPLYSPSVIRQYEKPNLYVLNEFRNSARTRFHFTKGSSLPSIDENSNAEAVFFSAWVTIRTPVKSIQDRIAEVVTRMGRAGKIAREAVQGRNLYFEHAYEFLDTEDEWYLDKTTGDLYYYTQGNPNSMDFFAPVEKTLLHVDGGTRHAPSNINFIHLRFEETTSETGKVDIYGEQNSRKRDMNDNHFFLDSAVVVKNLRRGKLTDCDFSNLGMLGIEFQDGVKNFSVVRCGFYDIGAGAIAVGKSVEEEVTLPQCDNVKIEDNYIERSATVYTDTPAIYVVNSEDTKVIYNSIHVTGYMGISVGQTLTDEVTVLKRNFVTNNDVGYAVKNHYDASGIYGVGNLGNGRFNYNYIHDSYAGNAFQFDRLASYYDVKFNLVHQIGPGQNGNGIHMNSNHNANIVNNIFGYCNKRVMKYGYKEQYYYGDDLVTYQRNIFVDTHPGNAHISNETDIFSLKKEKFTISKNIYFTKNLASNQKFDDYSFTEWKGLGHDSDSYIEENPDFVDSENGDYELTNPSRLNNLIGFIDWDRSNVGVSWK